MAKYFIEEATLKNMADTIRSLTGNTASMTPSEMTAEVQVAEENVESAMTALETLGVVIPEGSGIGNLADLVGDVESGVDTSDATALASDILNNKTAYVDGEKITGTIPTKTSSDLTVSGATVNVPTGYYASQVSKSVSTATQATPSISINSSGLITASATQSAGYVSVGTKSATKQLTTQASKTVTPGTTSQTAVGSGVYTTGAVTVVGDSNLVAGNIRSGKSIFGVNGTYVGSGGGSSSGGSEDFVNLIEGTMTEISNEDITITRQGAFAYASIISANLPACISVGSSAFVYCSKLTSIDLPACTSIGIYAFASCSKLASANLPACISVGTSAFAKCSKLASIDLPACTGIASYAFTSCSSLSSANLPACISVGSHAFVYCRSLSSIDLPACTSIKYYAFAGCSKLASVNLPACSSIENLAFRYCSILTTLILGYSSIVTLVNISAFESTPISISTLTGSFGSIYVPASLVSSYKAATNWATYADRITAII